MGTLSTLEVYVTEAEDGSVLGAARVGLAEGYYYMAAIGDSAMWGNGLRTHDKFSTLTADRVEEMLGQEVVLQVTALSGATIVPSEEDAGYCQGTCLGEVPYALTSITDQVDLIESPEQIELVLLDGCANDVGLSRILSEDTTSKELEDVTRQYCEDEMFGLLLKVHETMPSATIVVTGYFQILSEASDITALEDWIATQEALPLEADNISKQFDSLVTNSLVFYVTSRDSLQRAVDRLNGLVGENGPVAVYADPGFGPENAAFRERTVALGYICQQQPDQFV